MDQGSESQQIERNTNAIGDTEILAEPKVKVDNTRTRETLIDEVARRLYDENRKFVYTAPGMANQIYRNGILTKKTLDGDGVIRMKGSNNYYREYVLIHSQK